jgi:integrase
MAVLDNVPRIGRCDLVFTTNGVTPVSGWSKAKARIDRLSGVTDWVLHDLRRCISTWMNESGTDPHTAEAVLRHVVKGVGGVYNKASYLREKAEALDVWAEHVEEIAKVDVQLAEENAR